MSSNSSDEVGRPDMANSPSDAEFDAWLRRARRQNQRDQRRRLPKFFKRHAYKLSFLIAVLVAILGNQVYHNVQRRRHDEAQGTVDPGMVNHRLANPDHTARTAALHLDALEKKSAQLGDLVGLAGNVAAFARAGVLRSTNMAWDARDGLTMTAAVVNRSIDGVGAVVDTGKSIGVQLQETVATVRRDANAVPRDALKAVVHLEKTLKDVRIKLNAVVGMARLMVPNVEPNCRNFKLLGLALAEAIAPLEFDINRASKSFMGKLSNPNAAWVPGWAGWAGGLVSDTPKWLKQARKELACTRELAKRLARCVGDVCDPTQPLGVYAKLLADVRNDVRNEAIKGGDGLEEGGSWVNTMVLEMWASRGSRELVTPRVVQNYMLLLRMLERIQLREPGP